MLFYLRTEWAGMGRVSAVCGPFFEGLPSFFGGATFGLRVPFFMKSPVFDLKPRALGYTLKVHCVPIKFAKRCEIRVGLGREYSSNSKKIPS